MLSEELSANIVKQIDYYDSLLFMDPKYFNILYNTKSTEERYKRLIPLLLGYSYFNTTWYLTYTDEGGNKTTVQPLMALFRLYATEKDFSQETKDYTSLNKLFQDTQKQIKDIASSSIEKKEDNSTKITTAKDVADRWIQVQQENSEAMMDFASAHANHSKADLQKTKEAYNAYLKLILEVETILNGKDPVGDASAQDTKGDELRKKIEEIAEESELTKETLDKAKKTTATKKAEMQKAIKRLEVLIDGEGQEGILQKLVTEQKTELEKNRNAMAILSNRQPSDVINILKDIIAPNPELESQLTINEEMLQASKISVTNYVTQKKNTLLSSMLAQALRGIWPDKDNTFKLYLCDSCKFKTKDSKGNDLCVLIGTKGESLQGGDNPFTGWKQVIYSKQRYCTLHASPDVFNVAASFKEGGPVIIGGALNDKNTTRNVFWQPNEETIKNLNKVIKLNVNTKLAGDRPINVSKTTDPLNKSGNQEDYT